MIPSLAAIAAVVLDVDGVLTDGRLYYDSSGESLKTFAVRDGLGLKRLARAGIAIAVISGRQSAALEARLDELGIALRVLGTDDKGAALDRLLGILKIDESALLAIGDDVVDAPLLSRAAIGVAVADAHPELIALADWVTDAPGGHGAVREVADAILAARERPRFRVVIPSRYGSTRLPGKPLREIAGRPMIAHVWDRAVESGAAEVVVATDDERIRDAVLGFGGEVEMTSADHSSGTDRIAEVAARRGWPRDAVVVNLQGDEPALPGELVAAVATGLAAHRGAAIATLATPIAEPAQLFDPNAVKAVLADSGRALLFSRAPIPWVRDAFVPGQIPERLPDGVSFLRHIGLYAYRVKVLERLTNAPSATIERAESLEQLRAFDLGLDIHVTVVEKAPPDGVDTENDLARVARYLGR